MLVMREDTNMQTLQKSRTRLAGIAIRARKKAMADGSSAGIVSCYVDHTTLDGCAQ